MEEREAKRLVDSYADMILRVGTNYLKSVVEAEDVCQMVFLRYMTSAPTMKLGVSLNDSMLRIVAGMPMGAVAPML